jgi:flagellar protein FlgJ
MDALKAAPFFFTSPPAEVTPTQSRPAMGAAPQKSLEQTCREMESLFIFQLLKQMRATVDKSGFLDGGSAEEIYTSMLDSEIAKEISSGRGIGLGELLYRHLQQQNEAD